MSESNLNSFIPVTAVAKKIATSKLAQETQRLFFHQLQSQKESKDAFADYVVVIRTKAFGKLPAAEKEVYKVKLEDTCRKILTRLNLAGLKYEARRGAADLIFIFVLCPAERLKEELDRSRVHDWLVGVRIRDIDDDSSGSYLALTDAERLRLVHDIITNSRQDNGAGINPGLEDFELVESLLPLHDHNYNERGMQGCQSHNWRIDSILPTMEALGEESYCGTCNTPVQLNSVIYLPTIVYCALVPALNIFYIQIAKKLNEYENYETESSYEFNLTQKIFVANFLIGNLSIFFIGWIYIPFNEDIGYFFQSLFELFGLSLTIKSVGPERLVTELKYFILTAQVISLFTEVILPYLLRFGSLGMNKIKKEANNDGGKDEDESAFLKRVMREVNLPVYDVYEDYVEMVSQYGYVSLFSVIWPLTPVFAFINNLIELRSDAIKLCVHTRRPIPSRADSIGPWLDNLAFITWLSSITNPSIIYLYHSDTKGFTSTSGVIFTVVLVWFSEHIFDAVRYIVQQMLRAFPSEADDLVQREEYELKKRWLEKAGVSTMLPPDHELQEKKEGNGKWFRNEDLEEVLREILQEFKEE
ncbi:6234_t:CDS:2 [Acaulospora colombiana]|uniref:6234_t:CDS:1 n=1 Tax=Acaulospora colombiana TaxID=27376 RepID=A0ACA9JV09_9GLOM|nr:6234_t:CDS:2 [Acaulospora colombiana]